MGFSRHHRFMRFLRTTFQNFHVAFAFIRFRHLLAISHQTILTHTSPCRPPSRLRNGGLAWNTAPLLPCTRSILLAWPHHPSRSTSQSLGTWHKHIENVNHNCTCKSEREGRGGASRRLLTGNENDRRSERKTTCSKVRAKL